MIPSDFANPKLLLWHDDIFVRIILRLKAYPRILPWERDIPEFAIKPMGGSRFHGHVRGAEILELAEKILTLAKR